MNLSTLILITTIIYSSNAQQSNEQIAFDYFFTSIFPKDYSNKICKIGFGGKTINYISSFGHYKPCFDKNEVLFSGSFEKTDITIPIKTEKISKIRFKKRRSKYTVIVFKAYPYKDYYFVQIEFSKNNEYTYAYYLKIDKDKNVVKFCKVGEVW